MKHSLLARLATIALLFTPLSSSLLYAEQPTKIEDGRRITTIVQMSDPQFFYPDSKRSSDIPSEELANQALRYTERLKPDCVVVTGDLVQHIGDKDEIATFKRLFSALDPAIPLHYAPGNHDVTHQPKSIEAYRNHFGKDYYTFEIGEDRFLVLNSVLFGSKATKEKGAVDQWAWLEDELKKAKAAKARYTLVFLHHPLFAITPHEPEGYHNLPLKSRKRLFHLFEQYGVDAVFAGHYHRNMVNEYRGIDYIVTGSVCAPLVPEDPAGIRVIELGPDGITHRYVKQADYENEKSRG